MLPGVGIQDIWVITGNVMPEDWETYEFPKKYIK